MRANVHHSSDLCCLFTYVICLCVDLQAQHDLQKLEELRKKQYREHEMEKQFEYEQSLKGVDEKTKQERVKKHEEEEKRKKQKEEVSSILMFIRFGVIIADFTH